MAQLEKGASFSLISWQTGIREEINRLFKPAEMSIVSALNETFEDVTTGLRKLGFVSRRLIINNLNNQSICRDGSDLQLAVMVHPAKVKTIQSSMIWDEKKVVSVLFQKVWGPVKLSKGHILFKCLVTAVRSVKITGQCFYLNLRYVYSSKINLTSAHFSSR